MFEAPSRHFFAYKSRTWIAVAAQISCQMIAFGCSDNEKRFRFIPKGASHAEKIVPVILKNYAKSVLAWKNPVNSESQ